MAGGSSRLLVRALMAGGLALGACALASGPALAQALAKSQQKCLNGLNKDLGKIASTAGKDAGACLKSFAKSRTADLGPGGTAESCLSADVKGKVAKAAEKSRTGFGKLCPGEDRDGVPRLPPYGATDPNTVLAAALSSELGLIHDLFGSDLDAGLVTEAADKDLSRCQQAVAGSARKCHDARIKEFTRCKKQGLKSLKGAPPAIQSREDLEACIGADPKGKVAKLCDDPVKPDGIRKSIQKKCAAKGVGLREAFPACDTDGPEELHGCVAGAAACRTCDAINQADRMFGYPCPGCPFFQGTIGPQTCTLAEDAFCAGGARDGLPCTDTLTHTDCPGARCLNASTATLNIRTAQPLVTLPLTGELSLDCSAVDPGSGRAPCDCRIVRLDGIDIPLIGAVCFVPGDEPCPPSELDCDGGTPQDLDLISEHGIASCGVTDDPNQTDPNQLLGPAECQASCAVYCAALPGSYQVLDSGCEGYCVEGPREGALCRVDADCPHGDCVGGEPVAHAGKCECNCIQQAGHPGRRGSGVCIMRAGLDVEQDLPCDGTDLTISTVRRCVSLTTEAEGSVLLAADLREGEQIGPVQARGQPISCSQMAAGGPRGMTLVGDVHSIDSGLGDQVIQFRMTCGGP